jgi:hypothetical protein
MLLAEIINTHAHAFTWVLLEFCRNRCRNDDCTDDHHCSHHKLWLYEQADSHHRPDSRNINVGDSAVAQRTRPYRVPPPLGACCGCGSPDTFGAVVARGDALGDAPRTVRSTACAPIRDAAPRLPGPREGARHGVTRRSTSTAGRSSPISLALSPRSVVSPSPSCPQTLRPQHFT